MRVLIIGNCAPLIGGIETFVANEARALVERKIPVGVVSDGSAIACLTSEGFPVWTVPMGQPLRENDPGGILDAIAAIRATVEAFAPDVIHLNASGPELVLFDRALGRSSVPVLLTAHSDAFASASVVASRILARASAVTAVSAFIAERIIREGGTRAGHPVEVIENCLPPGAPPTRPKTGHRVLALGRLVHEKGMDTLVEAFVDVHRRWPDARLTIAGDGPERVKLCEQAARSGLAEAVALPGWVAPLAVRAMMDAASLVVVPSRWDEPFGLVTLEAARAGRPCIATRVGGLSSIVRDGVTGLLVPADDPVALAQALKRLLADPEFGWRLAREAHADMEQRYDFARMIDAYLARLGAVAAGFTSRGGTD